MIGGLSRTATTALRQLLDAGTLANLPAGFKQRGIRVRDEAQPLQPGEFRDVDAPGGDLNSAFMMLPFKGPNQHCYNSWVQWFKQGNVLQVSLTCKSVMVIKAQRSARLLHYWSVDRGLCLRYTKRCILSDEVRIYVNG